MIGCSRNTARAPPVFVGPNRARVHVRRTTTRAWSRSTSCHCSPQKTDSILHYKIKQTGTRCYSDRLVEEVEEVVERITSDPQYLTRAVESYRRYLAREVGGKRGVGRQAAPDSHPDEPPARRSSIWRRSRPNG
jgi:hypothetical protein